MVQKHAAFSRANRLQDKASYNRVFKQPSRSIDEYFTVLWCRNGIDRSRLGMAIGKKNLKRAVDRNLVKRVVRESFRIHLEELAGVDVVVLSRRGLPLHERQLLRVSLDRHWRRLARLLQQNSNTE